MKEYIGNNVLIVGLAKSGVAACKFLAERNFNVFAYDSQKEDSLLKVKEELKENRITYILEQDPMDWIEKMDSLILSPGVPLDLDFIQKAKELGKKIIGEFQLAAYYCTAPIVGITGTNGKTTTTTLVGEIFKNCTRKVFVVGNIGVPFISQVNQIQENDRVIAEISSFQLESIDTFHPKVSAILNFSPDHLNRHHTYENYIQAKANIFKNQIKEDFCILNKDDKECVKLAEKTDANILWFSRLEILDKGVFVQDNEIVIKDNESLYRVCSVEELKILGDHNLENALAATAMAYCMGISIDTIKHTLLEFQGVEHRIEIVDEIDEVIYINDSKGTNPDATIKAISAMKKPTILIAGGMDKGSDFENLAKTFSKKIKFLIVLGETADRIKSAAQNQGMDRIIEVNTIEEAVEKAHHVAEKGDCVLLSPACASWDMFENFEVRGRVFKEAVRALRG